MKTAYFSKNEMAAFQRDGFVVVTLFWGLLAFFGALPFLFAGVAPHMADAYFETMSGLTTTGIGCTAIR